MPLLKLFPSYLFYGPAASSRTVQSLNRELIKEVRQIEAQDQKGQRWCKKNYPFGYTSYGSFSELHRMSSTFAKLQRHIDRHVRHYAQAQEWNLSAKLEMDSCWVNINGPHSMHGLHLHPHAVVSGTYYVQIPPLSGPLKFEDPRLSSFMMAPSRRESCRPENRTFYKIQPKAGHLVLFESYIRHEVSPNAHPGHRVSISFNYR